MAQSLHSLIKLVRSRIHSLLHDDVIEHTIVVMTELNTGLAQLSRLMSRVDLTAEQKQELADILLPLVSESIREALHKGELPITNGIIRSKNRILQAIGVEVPPGHEEINPTDYAGYNW